MCSLFQSWCLYNYIHNLQCTFTTVSVSVCIIFMLWVQMFLNSFKVGVCTLTTVNVHLQLSMYIDNCQCVHQLDVSKPCLASLSSIHVATRATTHNASLLHEQKQSNGTNSSQSPLYTMGKNCVATHHHSSLLLVLKQEKDIIGQFPLVRENMVHFESIL